MPQQALCNACSRPAVQECPSCKDVVFCSPGCHDTGHLLHHLACQSLQAAPPKPDPESRRVLGVLFPDSAPAVSLVWVPISGFTDPDSGISFHEPEVASFLGTDDHASLASIHSERNRVRNRDTRSMLEIWHRKGAGDAGGANACIRALADLNLPGLDGAPFCDWKGGPVLVLFMTRSTGFMIDPGTYRDAGQQDFVDAVDFVLDHGNDIHERRIQQTLETLGRVVEKVDGGDAETGRSEPKPNLPGVAKGIVMEME